MAAQPLENASTIAPPGRGMTCAAFSSPTRPAASAPASTAARTLLTSPRTITLTTPPSSLMTGLASSTLAALSIASTALIRPTRPWVSIRPSAFPFMSDHAFSKAPGPRVGRGGVSADERAEDGVVGAGDDVGADQLADPAGRLGPGLDRGADAADVAPDQGRDVAGADP